MYRLPGNVYGFAEPQHFQEVNFYLIMGEERAVLLELTWRLFTDDALLEKIKKDHFDALHS